MKRKVKVAEMAKLAKRGETRQMIPQHLHPFIATQDYSLYTPIDHASWRYIMRVSAKFFAENAHQKYLDGLRETGVGLERIPLISEMDLKLQKFGWRAVPVVGFIPSAVFMEFLSLGILPIACDMRTLEHISYTPAPDIVHEAAGHAPIIADAAYADYLHHYGEIARKVIFSSHDDDVYEAIRLLSDTKEDPASIESQIQVAEASLERALGAVDFVSEATQLSRMGWWTIEYGLVGTLKNPKIYGAGLLSSAFESYHCISDEVPKIPFTIDCVNQSFDITKPQPQLYVASDFGSLTTALEELARTMAFKRGGVYGLDKAIQAKTVTTTEFETGLQVSGRLVEYLNDSEGEPCYLRYQGPTQIAHKDREIAGQGADYHKEGFSTPIGKLKKFGVTAADLSVAQLEQMQSEKGCEFESGIKIKGDLKRWMSDAGKNQILVFENCRVTLGERVLFDPSWGVFDMACGSRVTSVFGSAADRVSYMQATGGFKQVPKMPKTNLTAENQELNRLYQTVREIRERAIKRGNKFEVASRDGEELKRVSASLQECHQRDWLLRLELLEILPSESADRGKLRAELIGLAERSKSKMGDPTAELIFRGLDLTETKEIG